MINSSVRRVQDTGPAQFWMDCKHLGVALLAIALRAGVSSLLATRLALLVAGACCRAQRKHQLHMSVCRGQAGL